MKENITIKETLWAAAGSFSAVLVLTLFLDPGNDLFTQSGYSFFKNVFFTNITFMGDSIFAFAVAALLIFLFNRQDMGIKLLFAILISLFITQLIKNIFSDTPVQLFFEKNSYYFNDTSALNNIISSHVTIAFTLAAFFSVHTKKTIIRILLFSIAGLVAFSRIYIVQENIYVLIPGILTAAVSVILMMKISAGKNKALIIKRKKHQATVPENFSWY